MVLRASPASGTWQGPEAGPGHLAGCSQGPGWGPEPTAGRQRGQRLWRPGRRLRPAGWRAFRPRPRPEHLKLAAPSLQGRWARAAPRLGQPGPEPRGRGGLPGDGAGAAAGRRAAAGAGEPRRPGRPSWPGPPAAASLGAAPRPSWAWAGGHTELAGAPAGRTRRGRAAAPCSLCGRRSALRVLGPARSGSRGLRGRQNTRADGGHACGWETGAPSGGRRRRAGAAGTGAGAWRPSSRCGQGARWAATGLSTTDSTAPHVFGAKTPGRLSRSPRTPDPHRAPLARGDWWRQRPCQMPGARGAPTAPESATGREAQGRPVLWAEEPEGLSLRPLTSHTLVPAMAFRRDLSLGPQLRCSEPEIQHLQQVCPFPAAQDGETGTETDRRYLWCSGCATVPENERRAPQGSPWPPWVSSSRRGVGLWDLRERQEPGHPGRRCRGPGRAPWG